MSVQGQRAFLKYFNFMSKLVTYLAESRAELKKVSWPTRQEALKHTLIVIGMSLFVAFFLGLLDFIFAKGLTFIL
jgi:preprotein translocase subunit SecE